MLLSFHFTIVGHLVLVFDMKCHLNIFMFVVIEWQNVEKLKMYGILMQPTVKRYNYWLKRSLVKVVMNSTKGKWTLINVTESIFIWIGPSISDSVLHITC